jgi:hypothetical protein
MKRYLIIILLLSTHAFAKPPAKACPEPEIKKRIDAALTESERYFTELDKKSAAWKEDCEVARRDLVSLEDKAKKFYDTMLAYKQWAFKLEPACRERAAEMGEAHPTSVALNKRSPAVEQKVGPMIERCQAHPGFRDAMTKGLRVMRKKKPTAK